MVKKPTAAKSASAASLKAGRTDLFLPEELEELFEGNTPQAGDVLLLDGDGATSKLARLAQGGSSYSHVGLVIGSDLYIDAVGEGVRVRRIADMRNPKHEYALDRCTVARNRRVIATQVDVWNRAIKYYERPYELWSVFMKPGGAEVEDDPVICSKLVATIMADMGFDMPRAAQLTMPKHLDEECKGGDWEQFKLLKYDIFDDPASVPSQRIHYTDYWLKLLEPLHKVNITHRGLMQIGRLKTVKKKPRKLGKK